MNGGSLSVSGQGPPGVVGESHRRSVPDSDPSRTGTRRDGSGKREIRSGEESLPFCHKEDRSPSPLVVGEGVLWNRGVGLLPVDGDISRD